MEPEIPLLASRDELERKAVRDALEKAMGNIVRTAELLGVTRSWLNHKLAGSLADLAPLAKELRLAQTGRTHGRPAAAPLPSHAVLRKAWSECSGNIHAISRALAIPRSTLRRAYQEIGLLVVEGR